MQNAELLHSALLRSQGFVRALLDFGVWMHYATKGKARRVAVDDLLRLDGVLPLTM